MTTFSLKKGAKRSLFQKGVYPPEFDDAFKEHVRKRDRYRCQFPGCSATSQTQGRALDVHHIDYTKRTVATNCISLCRACHKKVHASGKKEKTLFRGMFHSIALSREGIIERIFR